MQAQPNHALEPTAPSHAEHRGSARIVGRTNETKKYGSTRKKNKSHLAAPRIRVIRIRSASDSRERALSGGGALLSFSSGGRVNSRHRAVGEAKCRNRASGLSTYGGVRLARRGTRARRRVSGVSGNFSGTVDAAGLFTAGASIRSSVSVTRPSGSSRTACWGHQHRSRQSVASPSRRLAGRLKRRGLFARSRRGMAHSDSRVIRSVRGERPEHFTFTVRVSSPLASPRAVRRVIRRCGTLGRFRS